MEPTTIEAIDELVRRQRMLRPSRECSLVITKLEEAGHWERERLRLAEAEGPTVITYGELDEQDRDRIANGLEP